MDTMSTFTQLFPFDCHEASMRSTSKSHHHRSHRVFLRSAGLPHLTHVTDLMPASAKCHCAPKKKSRYQAV
jgi:hypothetical protein